MRFPETYSVYPGGERERNVEQDLHAWVLSQPQDVWLMFVRCNGYDRHARLYEDLIETPDCDLGIISFIFWREQPGSKLTDRYRFDLSLQKKILTNFENGRYRAQSLSFDPAEIVHEVRDYIAACHGTKPEEWLFRLPKALCCPHTGARPRVPDRFDDETEQHLDVLLAATGSVLPRSENELKRCEADRFAVPCPAPGDAGHQEGPTADGLADVVWLERIFGTPRAFQRAARQSRIEARYLWSGSPGGRQPGIRDQLASLPHLLRSPHPAARRQALKLLLGTASLVAAVALLPVGLWVIAETLRLF